MMTWSGELNWPIWGRAGGGGDDGKLLFVTLDNGRRAEIHVTLEQLAIMGKSARRTLDRDDHRATIPTPNDNVTAYCAPDLHDGHRIAAHYLLRIESRKGFREMNMYACCAAHVHHGYQVLAPTPEERVIIRAV
jgi:hypothetical protein